MCGTVNGQLSIKTKDVETLSDDEGFQESLLSYNTYTKKGILIFSAFSKRLGTGGSRTAPTLNVTTHAGR